MVLVSRKRRPHGSSAAFHRHRLGSLSLGPSCEKTRPKILISTFQTFESVRKCHEITEDSADFDAVGVLWKVEETLKPSTETSDVQFHQEPDVVLSSSRHPMIFHVLSSSTNSQVLMPFLSILHVLSHFYGFFEAWCATRHQKSQNRVALGFAHLGVAPSLVGCDDMESGAGLRAPNGFVGRSSYSIWPCSPNFDHLQQILEALFNISSFLSISFSCMVVSCFTSFTSPNQTIKLFDPWNRVHLLILPRAKLQAFSQSIRDGIRHILHSHW